MSSDDAHTCNLDKWSGLLQLFPPKKTHSNGGPVHLRQRYSLEPEGNGYRIIRSVAFSQPLIRHYTYKSIVPQRFSASGVSSMSPTYN